MFNHQDILHLPKNHQVAICTGMVRKIQRCPRFPPPNWKPPTVPTFNEWLDGFREAQKPAKESYD